MNRSDTFNRTAALAGSTPSDGLGTWTNPSSTFSTGFDAGTGQTVCFVASGSSNQLAWLDCSATDHQAAVEIVSGATNQQGVCARLIDASNYYYYFADSSGNMFLYKNVAGSFTLLASGTHTFTPGVGSTITLKCQGSTISGYVGATLDVTVTDTSLTTGTNAGLRANTSTFFPFYDNLAITDLTAGGGSAVGADALHYYRTHVARMSA